MKKYILLIAILAMNCGIQSTLSAQETSRPLNYSTTWIGNSFGGGEKWVQNFIEGMFVASDGTVFTASPWDEAGREFGFYKDGNVIGKASDTHGWGTGGGYAVTANAQYIWIAHSHGNEGGGLKGEKYPPKGFTWFGISRRTRDGKPAPFAGGRGRFGDFLILHEVKEDSDAHIRGLAVDAQNRLYVADTFGNQIKVLDGHRMQPIAQWKVLRPRQIALDRDGTLWVIHDEVPAGRVPLWRRENNGVRVQQVSFDNVQDDQKPDPIPCIRRYDRDGKAQIQRMYFDRQIVPSALCVDHRGRLLVCDNGAAQQIIMYHDIRGTPALNGFFGVRGGMSAPPVAGASGPQRLVGLHGVGVDAAGNLYVGCNQSGGGAILRCFAPQITASRRGIIDAWSELKWELLGLEFVDGADVDPQSDGADVWTTDNRYTLDWGKPTGKQWTWRSQTIDPIRFPRDPRLHERHHDFTTPLFRRIADQPFLIVRGMFQHALVFYKLRGETAIPSAMFAKGPYRNGAWNRVPQPEGNTRWLWRDLNGDGDFQNSEFGEADGKRDPESWAWWVDEAGGVWQGDQNADAGNEQKPIAYFSMQGLDSKGNPIYDRKSMRRFALPDGMNHLLRLEYYPATDVMWLTGHTTERPKTGGEWGQVGTEVWRIDNWSKGNRAPKFRAVLPYDPETAVKTPGASVSNVTIKSFCTTEKYFFAVESRTAKVHVYDAGTGAKIGEMTPGVEVGKESGWVDFPDAIRAFKKSDGEYLVFVEEDAKAKIIVYRWKP